jgi:hypothetical protein
MSSAIGSPSMTLNHDVRCGVGKKSEIHVADEGASTRSVATMMLQDIASRPICSSLTGSILV